MWDQLHSKLMENNITAHAGELRWGGGSGLECCCSENVTFWVVLLTVAKNVNFPSTLLGFNAADFDEQSLSETPVTQKMKSFRRILDVAISHFFPLTYC